MSTKTLLSAEEFYDQMDSYGPCELVRGEVDPMPPGGVEHSEINMRAAAPLHQWARGSRLGRVLIGEPGVITHRGPDTVRGADVLYISYQRLPRGQKYRGFLETAPELIVEIVSERQPWQRAVQKAGEYLAMGVALVWLVNPRKRTVHVYRPDDEPQILSPDQTLEDPVVLPGFSCRVSEFFED